MRRLAAILLTLAAAGALAALAFGASAQGSSTNRIDVIFDDARGLIGGQLVKVAGAKAGTIQNVTVTADYKARIEMSVDSRFPFHTDATCTIRPEGLIAENYVECDPGTPGAALLQGTAGHAPTVPVSHTTEPVSLLDLFNIFNAPTRERFTVLINELGIGTAGEGDNFNNILLRANPALALARQVIGILVRQKSQLATLLDTTNTVAAEAAGHTAAVQDFIDRAGALATTVSDHRSALAQAVNRLPGLLAAAQPALSQLQTVALSGTPLLQQIHAATPYLNRVSNDLGPFVTAAKPGLAKLGTALRKAIPAIRHTTPLVRTLRAYADASRSNTLLFAKLSENLQRHGFIESFLSVAYYIAASLARYDSTSHLLGILLIGPQNGACGLYATAPVPGCSAHYGQEPAFSPAASAGAVRHAPARGSGVNGTRDAPALRASASRPPSHAAAKPSTGSATSSSTTTTTTAPAAPSSLQQTLQNLLQYLLR